MEGSLLHTLPGLPGYNGKLTCSLLHALLGYQVTTGKGHVLCYASSLASQEQETNLSTSG